MARVTRLGLSGISRPFTVGEHPALVLFITPTLHTSKVLDLPIDIIILDTGQQIFVIDRKIKVDV